MSHLIPTYNRLPIQFVKGEGCWLYDRQGKQYLDALSGIAVTNLGHAHPRLNQVLMEQAAKLWHTSNLYEISQQERLADRLCQIAQMHSCFICNSGSEANEAAIKLARLYAHKKHLKRSKIIVFENSFHGRTMGALSATSNNSIKQGFSPLLEGFITLPFNSIEALERVAAADDIVAVMFEPVQGEGGINIASDVFLESIAHLARHRDWLVICDEIQCGMGRSGRWYVHHQSPIQCDVLTTAKALGNGFPIAACLVNHRAVALFSEGRHGSTFGGNPLASAVACEVIDIVQQQNILTRVNQLAEWFAQKLAKRIQPLAGVAQIRQRGLLIGIELNANHFRLAEIVSTALSNQLLINLTATKVVRLLPPFILTEQQLELIIERLRQTLIDCSQ